MPVGGRSGPVVIAITSTADERVRLARLVDGYAPLLLVSSRQEARAFLDGYHPALSSDETTPEETAPLPVQAPAQPMSPQSVAPSVAQSVAPSVARAIPQPVSQPVPPRPRQVSHAGLRVDSDRHTVDWAGHETALTPLEHDLLVCMLAEPDRVWSFARLHQEVWGTQVVGAGSDVHSLVKRVRRKLARMGAPAGIDAIRGVGFRLSRLGEANDVPAEQPGPSGRPLPPVPPQVTPVTPPVPVPGAGLVPDPAPDAEAIAQSDGDCDRALVKPATG
jgi:DNA-binding winged helix-turn-helix (wHTH) protein